MTGQDRCMYDIRGDISGSPDNNIIPRFHISNINQQHLEVIWLVHNSIST